MPRASAWTTSPRRRSMPIRPGRRASRTTTRCRRWATPTPGSTARTGSSGRSCKPSSRRSTAATWRRLRPSSSSRRSPSSSRAARSTGRPSTASNIFTERGSEGITMGATGALYAWGFKYEAEPGTYQMEGAVNSPEAVEGLEFYKALYECCTRAGLHRQLHAGEPRRLQVRPGGDGDELVRLLPRPLQGRERRRRQDRLLRQPAAEGRGLDARRPGHLARVLLGEAGRGEGIHQVVRPARGAEEVVGARRLLGAQRRAERPVASSTASRSRPTS